MKKTYMGGWNLIIELFEMRVCMGWGVDWEAIVADLRNGVVTKFSQNFNLIFFTFHQKQAF